MQTPALDLLVCSADSREGGETAPVSPLPCIPDTRSEAGQQLRPAGEGCNVPTAPALVTPIRPGHTPRSYQPGAPPAPKSGQDPAAIVRALPLTGACTAVWHPGSL
ncbi:hypothetical protein NDU88_004934 [Pleurodeles waltl]|uniref:Uncharacterized protein n=1 Tax=Pleurodeles waltl TaxID=8319 RepID=A0AAV7SK80_PLEWA|nr:hypothetical protein NDU88_004934 [Pleurodeles waltl]